MTLPSRRNHRITAANTAAANKPNRSASTAGRLRRLAALLVAAAVPGWGAAAEPRPISYYHGAPLPPRPAAAPTAKPGQAARHGQAGKTAAKPQAADSVTAQSVPHALPTHLPLPMPARSATAKTAAPAPLKPPVPPGEGTVIPAGGAADGGTGLRLPSAVRPASHRQVGPAMPLPGVPERLAPTPAPGRPFPMPNGDLEPVGPSGRVLRDAPPPCPTPESLKKMQELTDDIAVDSRMLPRECPLGDHQYDGRHFAETVFTWKASALCHKPLYFEEVALERYGHSRIPALQPVVSGGVFFVNLAMLPYGMGLEPPDECIYVLGYYRPGSCAPYLRYPLPVQADAVLMEAAFVGGLVWLLP